MPEGTAGTAGTASTASTASTADKPGAEDSKLTIKKCKAHLAVWLAPGSAQWLSAGSPGRVCVSALGSANPADGFGSWAAVRAEHAPGPAYHIPLHHHCQVPVCIPYVVTLSLSSYGFVT